MPKADIFNPDFAIKKEIKIHQIEIVSAMDSIAQGMQLAIKNNQFQKFFDLNLDIYHLRQHLDDRAWSFFLDLSPYPETFVAYITKQFIQKNKAIPNDYTDDYQMAMTALKHKLNE